MKLTLLTKIPLRLSFTPGQGFRYKYLYIWHSSSDVLYEIKSNKVGFLDIYEL